MILGKPTWWSVKILALAVLTVAIGIAEGYFAHRQYDAREAAALEDTRFALQRAADLRARLIEPWAAGIVGGAQVVASFPSVVDVLAPPIRPTATRLDAHAVAAHVSTLLDSFIHLQRYRAASVTDRAGRPVVGRGDALRDTVVSDVRRQWLESGRDVIDLFLADGKPVVVAAVAVPVGSPPDRAAGLVLLVADPSSWLYPQLASDSSSDSSADYLLVRGAPTDAFLLSPPSDLVRPLPTHTFPRIKLAAPTGSGAVFSHGRGVSVIAAWRPVTGTPWAVLSKMDRAGVTTRLRREALGVLLQALTYLAVLLTLVFGMLHRRQTIHAAQQAEATRQIGFLNRLLLTISELNELMVREKDPQRLLDETCRIIVDHGGFRMAWVGELEPPARVKPVAWAGAVDGYLDAIDIRYDESPAGRGPTGTAIRERRTVSADDIERDLTMAPWRPRALERGYRASVAMPLVAGDRLLGALMVYSQVRGVFRGEALALLERLANDLAFALDVLEAEARHLETEEVLRVREEQLRQAQKMEAVGRLAGGVAHDFNNLLMAISGYAELALSAKTEELRGERIKEIAIAADKAAALTRQLLAFSRKQVLQPTVFNLNVVVGEIEKMLLRLIGDNVELVTSLARDLDNVRADPGQMEQVLVNLALNARDAMPDGGRVIIETRNVYGRSGEGIAGGELEPGKYVELSVTDTGHGMGPEVLDHLFEPFFTTKETEKGTGLGLSMVYGIVKQSGGAITVESGEGRGTTFRLYLPAALATDETEEAAPVVAPAPRAGGERLLVVEDNAAVRRFVTESLSIAGYEVVDADSAEAALDILADPRQNVDLLLTDVILPKVDGYELARRAVAARPLMRVLYMSGYVDNPRLRDAAMRDGIDLIEKPFTSAALAARVREVLDRPVHI